MKSVIRDKKKTNEILDQICGKEVVAEKVKAELSAKVGSIPEVESGAEVQKAGVVDKDILAGDGIQKMELNSMEKKHVADNIKQSVMNYKKENDHEKMEEDKPEVKSGSGNKNNISLAYNCPLPIGTVINGHYRIISKPRQGGFGMTYLATYSFENDGKKVAIKELYPYKAQRNVESGTIQVNWEDEEGTELLNNFKKEAARIEKLKEEKPEEEINKMNLVITKTEAFKDKVNHNWYYVMEYVPGDSLADIMFSFKDKKEFYAGLSVFYRFQIIDQLCNALENLHKIGCVHQDITPNNIMINFDTAGNISLKVIDYGLATNLYSFGDMSRSCIRYAGTHGFSDVLTQFAVYQKISNEIIQAEKNGNNKLVEQLTERLKTIDVYSCGALLGYLFLLDIAFIKDKGFNINYELAITNNTLVQPDEIDWNKDNSTIANIYKFNLIKKLVSDATAKELDKRIESVTEFRKRLHEIMKVDEEFIRRMKLSSGIRLWMEKAGDISSYVRNLMNEVKPVVSKSGKTVAEEYFNEGASCLKDADNKKDSILQMQITLDCDLDGVYENIKGINSLYAQAEECLIKAEEEATRSDGGHVDPRIVAIEKWLYDIPVKADSIKHFGDTVKSKVEGHEKAMGVWKKGSEYMNQAERWRTEIAKVSLHEASNEVLDETLQKTGLADTRYTMAETMWKEANKIGQYKGWMKLLKAVMAVLIVAGIGAGVYFGMDGGSNTKNPPSTDTVIVPPESTVNEGMNRSLKDLNGIFEAAQQKDNAAKQQVRELLDDKVIIFEKIGDSLFDTNYNLTTFFGVGNRDYIIGKTHEITGYKEENGRIIHIVLEELN